MLKSQLLAVAAAAAGLAASPAVAQTTITTFTTTNVIAALTQLGNRDASAQKNTLADGTVKDYVRFTNGGITHIAVLEVCNPGCLGLNLMTLWTEAGSVVDPRKINDFNSAVPFGKAVTAGSTLVLQRYTISDGGVSMDNVKSNIANFVGMTGPFMQYVGGGSTSTISARPGEAGVTAAVIGADDAAFIETLEGAVSNNWNTAVAADAGVPAEHLK